MSLPWFRMYTDFMTDWRIEALAFEDQRHYVFLLCAKCAGFLDQNYPNEVIRDRAIGRRLGLQGEALDNAKQRLLEVGLINNEWQPVAWEKRQQQSDSAAERMRKYRERRVANGLPSGSEGYQKHWRALLERDGNKCVYCGSDQNLCIDHVNPIVQGGTDEFSNLAIACKACNSGKSGRTPEQAGMRRPSYCNSAACDGNSDAIEGEGEGDKELRGSANADLSGTLREPRRSAAESRKEQREASRRLLEFLNDKTGRNYQPTDVNLEKITARLREGYTETQCRQVVAKKCREWSPDEKMALYLRPATLFGREKFNQYVGELGEREVSHAGG